MNAMARMAAAESSRVARTLGASTKPASAQRKRLGARLVLEFAEARGVEVHELLGRDDKRKGRSGELHNLRNECWAMLRDETSLSYPQIGRMFSGRDHTTIMTGVKKHRATTMKREAGK